MHYSKQADWAARYIAVFEPVATGLHLKEYTVSGLSDLFREVGFSKTTPYMGGAGWYLRPPLPAVRTLEKLFGAIPFRLWARMADVPVIIAFFYVRMVGWKWIGPATVR